MALFGGVPPPLAVLDPPRRGRVKKADVSSPSLLARETSTGAEGTCTQLAPETGSTPLALGDPEHIPQGRVDPCDP